MAIILSIETSGTICSIAIHNDGNLLSSQNLHIEKSHSAHLIPGIETLLKLTKIPMKKVDAIAVSAGPGSYTGLRIGVSSAKGLCYAMDKPLISVDTLMAMAHGINHNNISGSLLCPMIDARRMEVYTLLADPQLNIVEPVSSKIIDKHSYESLLDSRQITFFGSGALKCKEIIRNDSAYFISDFKMSAEHMGQMAFQKYLDEEFEDQAYFEPFYLKEFFTAKPKSK